MSAAQGEAFYGFLRGTFKRKLQKQVAQKIKERISGLFGFDIADEEYNAMASVINETNAQYEFSQIVQYLTGFDPENVLPEDRDKPGMHPSLALLYRGYSAVGKIRSRLGESDPAKAAAGTIRSDFGQSIRQNAAHASDSVQRAIHERKIIGLYDNAGDDCTKIITSWLRAV